MTPRIEGEGEVAMPPDAVDRWLSRVNADAEFKLASRWSDVRFDILRDGDRRCYRIRSSTLSRADGDGCDEEVIGLRGSGDAWRALLQPVPARHSHNVLAMDRRRDDFAIEAGRHHLIQNLRVIALVFDLLRTTLSDAGATLEVGKAGQ